MPPRSAMEQFATPRCSPGLLFEPEFGPRVKEPADRAGHRGADRTQASARPSSRAGLGPPARSARGLLCRLAQRYRRRRIPMPSPWCPGLTDVDAIFALRPATFLPRQAAGRGPGLIWVMADRTAALYWKRRPALPTLATITDQHYGKCFLYVHCRCRQLLPCRPEHAACSLSRSRRGASARDASDRPKALIVPHAGYIYSGAVAANAYASLGPGRANRYAVWCCFGRVTASRCVAWPCPRRCSSIRRLARSVDREYWLALQQRPGSSSRMPRTHRAQPGGAAALPADPARAFHAHPVLIGSADPKAVQPCSKPFGAAGDAYRGES